MTSVVVNAQPTKCSATPLFARMNSCAPSPQLPYGGDDFSRRQCPANQMLRPSAIRTNEFMRSFPLNSLTEAMTSVVVNAQPTKCSTTPLSPESGLVHPFH